MSMVDNKLEYEEAQRAANYEAVKSSVQANVDAQIAAKARQASVSQNAYVEDLAKDMRSKAVEEVAETEKEVERSRFLARVSQVVDYIFFVIYSLLAIRLLLELFAARESAGFVKFIKSATGIFYAPFDGIVPSLAKDGFMLALPIVVAIVSYMVLHLAINGLLRMFAHRKTTI